MARVDRVSPIVDARTGTVKVTVDIGGQPGLRPGLYVDVELVTAREDDALSAPTAMLHGIEKKRVARDFDEYEEPLPGRRVPAAMGDCFFSEFEATGIRGCRATVIGGMCRIRIVCSCPEGQYDELKPAFDRVIQSIDYGPKAEIPEI